MTESYCLGGRHRSETFNETQNEKINPTTKKGINNKRSMCNLW